MWQYFSIDQAVSAENSSFSVDAKLTDDDNASWHHCGRCNRRRKEVKLSCSNLFDVKKSQNITQKLSTTKLEPRGGGHMVRS